MLAARFRSRAEARASFRSRAEARASTIVVGGVLALISLGAGACARVAPYERETLARRDMDPAGHVALAAGEEHAQAYREGSSGGGDAKGGGCGCN